MSSSQRLTLRQSVALVWRTLRSMRTALILLLLIALASVAGSLLPQWPNTPDRVLRLPGRPPVLGHVLRPGGTVRRLRVVVVRAARDAAVRLARRVPRAEDEGALAGRAHPADAGSRDRRVPAVRGGRRSPTRPTGRSRPRAARCAGGGSASRGTPIARRSRRTRASRARSGASRSTGRSSCCWRAWSTARAPGSAG